MEAWKRGSVEVWKCGSVEMLPQLVSTLQRVIDGVITLTLSEVWKCGNDFLGVLYSVQKKNKKVAQAFFFFFFYARASLEIASTLSTLGDKWRRDAT